MGLIMTVVSLVVLYSMAGLLTYFKFSLIEAYWTDTWMAGLLIFPHIIMISMIIGVWVILLWSLYHALKYRIGRWTWLALLGAVIIPHWIHALFESSNLYKLLTQWGRLSMSFPTFSIRSYTHIYRRIFVFLYYYHWIILFECLDH